MNGTDPDSARTEGLDAPAFGPYASPEVRRRWAVRALAVVLLVVLVEVLWEVVGIAAAGGVLAPLPAGWWDGYDLVWTWLQALHFLLFFLAGGAFILWQRRVVSNSAFFGCELPQPGPNMAAASWFIPLVNLVVPMQSLRQVAQWSRPDHVRPGSPVVSLWWAGWLISSGVMMAGSFVSFVAMDLQGWINASAVETVGLEILLATGVLAIHIVNTVSRHQESRVP